jgi:hypothetical protein
MKFSAIPIVAIAILSYTVQAADSGKDQAITGTYEFIICKGACTFSDRGNVFATAVVAFFDGPITWSDRQRIKPIYRYDPSDVRACYAVSRKVQVKSYLGIQKTGVSEWKFDGHTLQFMLFHSADAGYVVEVDRTGDLLIGTGKSWGVGGGAAPPGYGTDTAIGRRLGPADISVCAIGPSP